MVVAKHRRPARPRTAVGGDQRPGVDLEPALWIRGDVAARQRGLDCSGAPDQQAAHLDLAAPRVADDAVEQMS